MLFTEHAFRQRERRHVGAIGEPTIELAHRIRYSSKTPPRRRRGGELAVVVQSAGFQITAKTLSSSCPAARPRLA